MTQKEYEDQCIRKIFDIVYGLDELDITNLEKYQFIITLQNKCNLIFDSIIRPYDDAVRKAVEDHENH